MVAGCTPATRPCVSLAKDEALIHEHARRGDFPADKITEIRRMIAPITATEASSVILKG